nr:ABC transporter G family member 7 isoform X2 [Ipomoea batatas]
MGPSGSGKTTLLNVLAGQIKASTKLHLSGLLEINGQPFSNKPFKFAYIRQEDLFFSQLTVKETLSLAAELQLQDISSVEEREEYVNNLLFKLGLVMLPSLSYLIFIVLLVKPQKQSNGCFL